MKYLDGSTPTEVELDDLIEQLAELRKVHKTRPTPRTAEQVRILKTILFPFLYGMRQVPSKSVEEMLGARVKMTVEQRNLLDKLSTVIPSQLAALQLPPYVLTPIARNLPPSDTLQEWHPWTEGATIDGGRVSPAYMGRMVGHTFEEALANWSRKNPERAPFLHWPAGNGRPSYYGMRIFLTEQEARAANYS